MGNWAEFDSHQLRGVFDVASAAFLTPGIEVEHQRLVDIGYQNVDEFGEDFIHIYSPPGQQIYDADGTGSAFHNARTGALADASIVWMKKPDAKLLQQCATGHPSSPETGATVLVTCVHNENAGVDAALSGPGIENTTHTCLPVGAKFLATRNTQVADYPFGIDLLLLCGQGIIGIPRSTTVEVIGHVRDACGN